MNIEVGELLRVGDYHDYEADPALDPIGLAIGTESVDRWTAIAAPPRIAASEFTT